MRRNEYDKPATRKTYLRSVSAIRLSPRYGQCASANDFAMLLELPLPEK
jgi:hypothetical protein